MAGHALGQGDVRNVLQRDRALLGGDDFGGAAEVAQPGGEVLGVGDRAAQQEQASAVWGECDGAFVMTATGGVGDHLIFVDDEQGGAFSAHESLDLGFKSSDEDWGVDVFRDVSGGDADVPFGVLPLGVFVIGEGAGGHGIDSLTLVLVMTGLMQEFEDVGFSGSRGGTDDDIGASPQMIDGLVLPEIGKLEGVEGREHDGKKGEP